MANKTFQVSEAIQAGWDYAKKHGLLVAVIICGTALISNGISNLFVGSSTTGYDAGKILGERMAQGDVEAMKEYFDLLGNASAGSLVSVILTLIVMTGLYNFALQVMTKRADSLEFSVFNLSLSTYIKYVCTQIIVGLISAIGFICCILPGIFLSARLDFASLHIIDNPECGIFEAIAYSWRITSGNSWTLILLQLSFILVCIAGLLCCCVGVYFAEVVTLFATVYTYLVLKD